MRRTFTLAMIAMAVSLGGSPGFAGPSTLFTAKGNPIRCEGLFGSTPESRTSAPSDSELALSATAAHAYNLKWHFNTPFNATQLANAWRKNGLFRQQGFYDAIGIDPVQIQNFYESWYGRPSKKFPLFKEALPPRLLALSLDPGIVGNSAEFIEFANGYLKKNPHTSIIELRNAFSSLLGTKKYYRGLALSPEAVEIIRSQGIAPRALTYKDFVQEKYPPHADPDAPKSRLEEELRSWASLLQSGPKNDMLKRITEGGQERFSQSISEFPEVAVFATKNFGRHGQGIYVFELEIPVLEVTDAWRVTNKMGHAPFESLGKQFFMDQPGVEAFVTGTIEPDWIKSVSEHGTAEKKAKFVED